MQCRPNQRVASSLCALCTTCTRECFHLNLPSTRARVCAHVCRLCTRVRQTVHCIKYDSALDDTATLVKKIREAHTQNGELLLFDPHPRPTPRASHPTRSRATDLRQCPATGGPFLSIAIAQHGPNAENEWTWTKDLMGGWPRAPA